MRFPSFLLCCHNSGTYDHNSLILSEEVPTPKAAPKATKAVKSKATAEPASKTSTGNKRKASAGPQPYSDAAAFDLFSTYADEDNEDFIGPSGFERLCEDAELSLDGTQPLIVSWLFKPESDTPEMMSIQQKAWIAGCKNLKISSLPALKQAVSDLESLLIMNVPKSKSASKAEPYDQTVYRSYTQDPKAALKKLYSFCFTLAKPEASKNIEMETAVAMWSVLLSTRYPLINEIIDFINENGGYKAANKDLWSMMFEFVNTVEPNLTGYEADGAWPSVIDAFVEWKQAKLSLGEHVVVD
jgi:DCN1-like protein 4/5